MDQRFYSKLTVGLFGAAIFVSAFLLFQVQPIIGKFVLPWFGGSPGVWTTCMLFFQVMLFAGYSYAHLLNRLLSVRQQILVHCILLVLAVLSLPITPSPEWKPVGNQSPTGLILVLLTYKIGLPYFLLSATGPLLQSWLGSSQACESPYRLYSLSNVGSLLALLSFPFLVEPSLSSLQQSWIWSWAFAGFAVLCGMSGWVLYRAGQGVRTIENSDQDRPLAWSSRLAWFSLPALACVLLLSTTNQICMDLGSIPFLWIAPLTAYLLSFILTFDSHRWYHRRLFIALAIAAYLLMYTLKLMGFRASLPLEVGLYITGLFSVCMICHGEVVSLKPHARRLTSFYLTLSAGGACGGLFVGLIAPHIFQGYFEWHLGLLASFLLFADLCLRPWGMWKERVTAAFKLTAVTATLLCATLVFSTCNTVSEQVLVAKRNFYGVLSVISRTDTTTGNKLRELVHGRIVHGSQWEQSDDRLLPTTYFTRNSGVGVALTRHLPNSPRRIGVIGLGAGTLATYGNSGDVIRFYEINPDVIELAKKHFSFLSDSEAKIELVLGDARLMLERESPQQFDVLVLDAFSGDAIPVHLLTEEAMKLYDSHLKQDGVLAFHISNAYFDLRPIVAGLARNCAYQFHEVLGKADPSQSALSSLWVLLSKETASLETLLEQSPLSIPAGKAVLWTDDRNNLFEALR